jgi:hypothetical protein
MRITIDIPEAEQKPQIEISQTQEMPGVIDAGGPPPELQSFLPQAASPQEAEANAQEQPGGSPPHWLLQAVENDRVGESSPLRAIPIEERFSDSQEPASGGEAPE